MRPVAWVALISGGLLQVSSALGVRGADKADSSSYPIVAVWAHPSNSSVPECGGTCEFVKAAYVKWLESAGVRSLPVPFDATPEKLKPILDGVNGLLFPGGTPPPPPGARWAVQYARDINDSGDFFPVWGTCLGWEWLAEIMAGDYPVLRDDFDAENFTQPLGLLPGAADSSRMLSGVSPELLEKATTESLTANAHRKGVAPEDFAKSGLDQEFRTLAINADRQGRTYVSAVEAFEFPIYGLQWHPEKLLLLLLLLPFWDGITFLRAHVQNQFDWGLDPDGTPHHLINHSADAVQLSQVLATFFASEARRSRHSFPSIAEWEPKMFHNREVTPTGPSTGQRYLFHPKDETNSLAPSPKEPIIGRRK